MRIGGKPMYIWRAVDAEGEVLDMLLQKRRKEGRSTETSPAVARSGLRSGRDRNGRAAVVPRRSEGARRSGPPLSWSPPRQQPGRELAPTDPTTRAQIRRFKSQGQAQQFVSTFGAIYNTFNLQRHLVSRKTLRIFRAAASAKWIAASAARSQPCPSKVSCVPMELT